MRAGRSVERFSPKRILRWLTICMLTGFLIGALAISLSGLQDRVVQSDLAVVPGNTVDADGKPSKRLQGRLDAALELYRAGYCRAILVSGGTGSEGFDEAAVMKTYLVEHGVPAEVIYADNHGINTFETARFTAALLRAKGLRDPILVSQYFHIARFRLALRKHGIESAGNVHSRYYELRDLYSLAREVFGYVEYSLERIQSS